MLKFIEPVTMLPTVCCNNSQEFLTPAIYNIILLICIIYNTVLLTIIYYMHQSPELSKLLVIESVDSISKDERGFPLTQYITNGRISRARYTITHFKHYHRVLRLISYRVSV